MKQKVNYLDIKILISQVMWILVSLLLTGYIFIMNGGPVTWLSQKQHTVALSTTEAGFVAPSESAICEADDRIHVVTNCRA